jgi:sec-independent protein translocase protein TatB
MLPEVGGLEYLVIAVVALIVVGPKDLPVMLRKVGQFVGKLRGMAAEFRASFDEMARQSELDDLRKEVEAMRKGQFADQAAHDATNVEVSQIFNEIGDSLNSGGVSFYPGQQMTPLEPAPVEVDEAEAKPRARKTAAKATSATPKATKPKTTKPKVAAARATAVKTAAKAPTRRTTKPKAGSPA